MTDGSPDFLDDVQGHSEYERAMETAFSDYAEETGYELHRDHLAIYWRADDLDRWLVARHHPGDRYEILGVAVLRMRDEDDVGAHYVAGYRRSTRTEHPSQFVPAIRHVARMVSSMGMLQLPPLEQGEWRNPLQPAPGPREWRAVLLSDSCPKTVEPTCTYDDPGYIRAEDGNPIEEARDWHWSSDDSDMSHLVGARVSDEAPEGPYLGP